MNALFNLKCRTTALQIAALLSFCFLSAAIPASAQSDRSSWWPARPKGAISAERSGSIPTRDALELVLAADRGDVRVLNDASGEVRYQISIEAASASPNSREQLQKFVVETHSTPRGVMLEGRLPAGAASQSVWVRYEIHVPRHYNLRLSTRAGEIVTSDVQGRVNLVTGGGSIQTGKIGDFNATRSEPVTIPPPEEIVARLETAGGRIDVLDVAGSLFASSGGGHIVAGNIFGDAHIQSRGGEVRIGRIAGSGHVSTGGGNIFVQSAENLFAETAGGHIDVAEVSGPFQTRRMGGREELRMTAGSQQPESGESAPRARSASPAPHTTTSDAPGDEDLPQAEIPAGPWDALAHGPLWELSRKIENFWWGAVRVDPAEQQKRLIEAPVPEYPEAARRAGIEGQVTFLLRIGTDGSVQDATLLYGEPVLGRAAAHAIQQWRYAPLRIGGEPVNVLTSVTLAFELQ